MENFTITIARQYGSGGRTVGKMLAEKLAENAPKRTGGLAESVKAGAVKYDAGNGYYCKVAPDGKNAQGESYA